MKLVLYGVLLLSFVLFSYLFIDPNFFYLKDFYTGFAFSNRDIVTILYLAFLLLLFTSYVYILKNIKMFDILKLKVFMGITVILVLAYPATLSYDIFNYLTTAKVTFQYFENPYIVMPIEFTGDSNLLFTHAANKIALYGPFWIGLTSLPFFLGFGNFLLTLFAFKVLIALFYIATVLLVWKMTKNLFSVAFFALSPVVIVESLVSGHNDIVMMFLALYSFYFLKNKKILLAIIFLFFSILVKYATIFLVPVFIYVLWQKKKGEVKWERVFQIAFFSMVAIFLLSQFREEIYPWYGIWFLTFAALTPNKKFVLYLSLALSFGLLFRYVPFMYWGTHFGLTPLVRNLMTFIPPLIFLLYYSMKNKIWLKIFP